MTDAPSPVSAPQPAEAEAHDPLLGAPGYDPKRPKLSALPVLAGLGITVVMLLIGLLA
ncbi:hypothetical protein [Leucobacter sp. M11]|uniref:hypothetical protein n=1 Tax=Leucobacter sp. M11 TaxID=2993565 RepID=UPI002D7EF4B9|nr:hypothetical protein [Leucobacter sp. M11]MEB4613538.1 hypothetical protein [Leucobacter sp. M11]